LRLINYLAPAFSYQKGISGINKLNVFYIRTSFVCRKIEDGSPHYRKGHNNLLNQLYFGHLSCLTITSFKYKCMLLKYVSLFSDFTQTISKD
jgi:hypothetical protein